jgi:hypothetical protein
MKSINRYLLLTNFIFFIGCGGSTTNSSDAGQDAVPDGNNQQNTIVSGQVVDSAGTPVPRALVVIHSNPVQVETAADGSFEVQVELGQHTMTISKRGVVFHQSTFNLPGPEGLDLGVLEPTDDYYYERLFVNQAGYIGKDFTYYNFFSSLSVEDPDGKIFDGIDPGLFSLSEAVISKADNRVLHQVPINLEEQIADDWREASAFEKTTSQEKMDIVVVYDDTGSMDEFLPAAIDQMIEACDRLRAAHVDFRMAGISNEVTPEPRIVWPFRDGASEYDKLVEDINYWFIRTGGEWWGASTTYDGILASPFLDFREDARKIILVITDVVSGTVYGTFWYSVSCTDATRSAVELFAQEQDVEIFYSQNPDPHPNFSAYCDSGANPRACDQGNPDWNIEGSGYMDLHWGPLDNQKTATELAWPFSAQDFIDKLGDIEKPFIDSRYLFTWESTIDWYDPVNIAGHEDEYDIRVNIELPDPHDDNNILQTSFRVSPNATTYTLTVNLADEEGNNPNDEFRADLFHYFDGRLNRTSYGIVMENGRMQVDDVSPGNYLFNVFDGGKHDSQYFHLRAQDYVSFEMPTQDYSFDWRVTTGDHLADKYKLLGFVRDLDDWRLSGDPFKKFAQNTLLWLAGIESDGLSWEEMVALRRLNIALSGYANMTEYAQFETDRAIEDFVIIIKDVRSVIKAIKALQNSTNLAWYEALGAKVIEALWAFITRGESLKLKKAVEFGLEMLKQYAANHAVREIKEHVIDSLPIMGAPLAWVQILLDELSEAEFTEDNEGFEWKKKPDMDKVVKASMDVCISLALGVGQILIEQLVIDEVFDELDLEEPLDCALKDLIHELLSSITSTQGIDNLDQALEKWAQEVGLCIYNYERSHLQELVLDFYKKIDDALARKGVPADVRDLFVGIIRDLSVEAIPTVHHNQLNFKLNQDKIIRIIVKHALYSVVIKDFFVDEFQDGLNQALQNAKRYAQFGPPIGADRYDWEQEMQSDFPAYRQIVEDIQAQAWNALSLQDAIQNWAEGLQVLVQLLDALSHPLDVIAYMFPDLEPAAEAVHGLILVLDSIQVVAKAIEFGLKLENLETLGDQAQDLYQAAFGGGQ